MKPIAYPRVEISSEWMKRKKLKSDESYILSVEWTGDFFNVRDMVEAVSKRLFCGSGTMLYGDDGGSPRRDASFSIRTHSSVSRVFSRLERLFRLHPHKAQLVSIHVWKDGDKGCADMIKAWYMPESPPSKPKRAARKVGKKARKGRK